MRSPTVSRPTGQSGFSTVPPCRSNSCGDDWERWDALTNIFWMNLFLCSPRNAGIWIGIATMSTHRISLFGEHWPWKLLNYKLLLKPNYLLSAQIRLQAKTHITLIFCLGFWRAQKTYFTSFYPYYTSIIIIKLLEIIWNWWQITVNNTLVHFAQPVQSRNVGIFCLTVLDNTHEHRMAEHWASTFTPSAEVVTEPNQHLVSHKDGTHVDTWHMLLHTLLCYTSCLFRFQRAGMLSNITHWGSI